MIPRPRPRLQFNIESTLSWFPPIRAAGKTHRRIYYSRSRSTFRRLPAPRPRHLSPRAIRARDLVVHRSTIRPPVTTSRMISVVPITVAT